MIYLKVGLSIQALSKFLLECYIHTNHLAEFVHYTLRKCIFYSSNKFGCGNIYKRATLLYTRL